ncbi:conserved Plasmodium protein, unknown function [Plasmodium knowlesi strain H]|uniref:Uncharacterized protein n=1 Tax=Plasmodium knowlesi (strain H) TaxID=5851 RepID=A0A679L8A3_PLAKH|nr:conserved Plasmodium protein, unknown function [Plasmodium knowlesi strain H]CAA9991249.1 conserved Plasmodium protein, unknown function [Plasmodium knowlesi strain H]VVS80723.1 conserved Plasmodium protein, unknown function [Plasmodium knowlesi strain H]
MKEGKQKVVGIHGDPQNNKRPRDKKRNSSDNKDEYNELLKYKQSFYIIRKTVNLIKNHYSNKINKADTLRERERKHLSHLKRENVILEDKCTFYAEHVEELKKIYTEQIKLKNNKIESLQDELDKMRKVTEVGDESNNTRILKLREDQIERLSQQLDSINGLYYKQVDSNKKLMKEIEELNKSILYLNNKIQEEKNNRDNVRRRLKYYKRYTKNKKRFKLNFDMMVDEEDSGRTNEEEDICVSVLCHLKTELDMIDEENKKKEEKRGVNHGDNNWNRNSNKYMDKDRIKIQSNNFFQKIFQSNYTKKKKKKKKKYTLFDTIYKKQFFSFYEKAFTENSDVKFENKKVLSSPVKNLKKKNDGNIVFHKDMKENIQNREAKRDMSRKDNNGSSNGHGGFIKHNGMDPKKGNNWNPLTLNDIYFYSNFDDNFDNKCDYFDQDTPSSGRPSVGEAKESAHCLDGEVKESKRIDEGTERTSLKTADGTPHGCTPQKTNSTVEHFPAGV